MKLGTDWYQISSSGNGIHHDSPDRSSIRHRRMTLHGKTTLGQLPDRREMAAVAGAANGTNLGVYVDWRVRESRQHGY
jgi:hypothetical protein